MTNQIIKSTNKPKNKIYNIKLTSKQIELLNLFIADLGDKYPICGGGMEEKFSSVFNKKEQKQIANEIYTQNLDVYDDYAPKFEDLDEFALLYWLKDSINNQI